MGILTACTKEIGSSTQTSILTFSGLLQGRTCLLIAPVIVSLGGPFGEYIPLTIFGFLGIIGGTAMIFIGISKILENNEINAKINS